MESFYNIIETDGYETTAKELNITAADAKAAGPDVLAAMIATKYAVWLSCAIERTGFNDFKTVLETAKRFLSINKDWIPCSWDYYSGKYVGLSFESLENDFGCNASQSTLTAAEYFANSDAYKEIKKAFALNHNITVEQIPDFLTSQGIPEDAAIRTDIIISWFFNTTYETCKNKDVEIANLTNQLNMMSSNSVPDKPVTSLTMDAATHVAMLEKDIQILEARVKRANEALKAAGLEEV
jgi:hypothetical protein